MISPGKFREVITLEEPGTPGTLGQPTWQTFASGLRAQLADARTSPWSAGHELNLPALGGSEITHIFTLRYLPGVSAKMRVTMDMRIFHVTHVVVQDEGTLRYLLIVARELMTA
jgi:head-tail adaptor